MNAIHTAKNYPVQLALQRLLGRTEVYCELLAEGFGLPATELAAGLAGALLAKTGGQALGARHQLSALRPKAAKRSQAVEPVAVARGSHRGAQNPQKTYWARMTKAQRSAEIARRRRKWSPEARAKWQHKNKPKAG